MIKKLLSEPIKVTNVQTENEDWLKFKSDSDEKMSSSEKRVDEFKKQSGKIKRSLQSGFNKKVAHLEQKNIAVRKKMKDYTDDTMDKQKKFKKEFTKDVNNLG